MLPPRAVESAVYPYLGPRRTIDDVEAARQALESAYRTAGYNTVFVDIPEQTVDAGIVRLQVTEGKLDRLRVTGARYFSNRKILAALPALESGNVPYFPDVQQQLTALNRETPDRAVTPVLRAGRYPGTVDLELRVQDQFPLHGAFEVNDRYTADTTQLRSSLTLSYDNLWQKAHSASLQYQVAPEAPDEASVLAATYIARLHRARTVLALYGVDSSSDVATVGALSVIGQGKIFGVRGIRLLDGVGRFHHNLTLGLDIKNFDEDIKLTSEDGLATAIDYANWSALYAFGWTLTKSSSEFSIGADWGMRGLGNDDAEFENKRFKARGNYAYLLGGLEHTHTIPGGLRLGIRLDWQLAGEPLVSNEQFSAGGVASVRGYLEAERLGDSGASASVEIRSPALLESAAAVETLELYGFFDAASLAVLEPLPDQIARFRLSSAGVGVRFSGFDGMSAEIDWARPLRDGANVLEGDDRLHFSLGYAF